MPKDNRPTVYSSSSGGDLRKKQAQGHAYPRLSVSPANQDLKLHRESKGRGGKTVSIVKGLILNEKDTKALAKKLKQTCGTGGTIKDGEIEIQGDHRTKMMAVLEKLGYKVKIAGG